jgi:hypothetical protein
MTKKSDVFAIANDLLEWMKEKQIVLIPKVHRDVIVPFEKESGYPMFDIWKAFDLLRDFGKVVGNYNSRRVCNYDFVPSIASTVSNLVALTAKLSDAEKSIKDIKTSIIKIHMQIESTQKY